MTTTETKKPAGESPDAGGGAEAQQPDEQWVVTFSGQTGQIAKIEKLEPDGQRTELNEEEYAAVAGHDMSGLSDFSDPYGYAIYGYDPYGYDQLSYDPSGYDPSGYDPSGFAAYGGDPYGLEEAYYQGVADSQAMMGVSDPSGMSGEYELSPEEQAYYQGMQDYMTASGN